jgi:hypothetical protein
MYNHLGVYNHPEIIIVGLTPRWIPLKMADFQGLW